MMKYLISKFILCLMFCATALLASACPVCERQNTTLLKRVTHGRGPENGMDYIIIFVAVAIVLMTLYFSLKYLIRPGENSGGHIKRQILEQY